MFRIAIFAILSIYLLPVTAQYPGIWLPYCNFMGCDPTPECRCGGRCGNTRICDEQARREWAQYPVCTGPCAMWDGRPTFRFVE